MWFILMFVCFLDFFLIKGNKGDWGYNGFFGVLGNLG